MTFIDPRPTMCESKPVDLAAEIRDLRLAVIELKKLVQILIQEKTK